MANQDQSRNVPPKGQDKPEQTGSASGQDYRGDGPARHGLTSDEQPGLVAPSGVNERDAGDTPTGTALDFDDGTDMAHPRGNVTRTGGTWNDKQASDAGDLGAPGAGLSDRNGPSDPDAKSNR